MLINFAQETFTLNLISKRQFLIHLLKNTIRSTLVYFILCAATLLMLRVISEHVTLQPDAGFLKAKQEYIQNELWLIAFYIHVFSAVLTLLAGFTQFSSRLLKENRQLHRFLGKFYVFNILFVNFPTGMIMAFYANGEWHTRLAFIILDSLWFWFTLKGFLEIKKGNVKAHREFMIRSYALTFSAITLRSWKIILSSLFVMDSATLYMVEAWIGFIPNLLFAEWLIRRTKPSPFKHNTE